MQGFLIYSKGAALTANPGRPMKHCPDPECPQLVRFDRVSEYRDEASVCADCGGTLATGEAPSSLAEPAYPELVTIYDAPDPIRGHPLPGLPEDRVDDDTMAGFARAARAQSARFIGGCCGTGAATLTAMAAALAENEAHR